MILFQFHSQTDYTRALRILQSASLRVNAETPDTLGRPYQIWFFPAEVDTQQKREAFNRVRGFEAKDHARHQPIHTPNLAEPPA